MDETLTLPITLPREFIALLGEPAQATETAREYVILGLFQEARISGGKAAELLGLTREGFLALMVRRGIPYFRQEPEGLEAEMERMRASRALGE